MPVTLIKPGTSAGRVCLTNLSRARTLVYFFDKDAEGRDRPNKHARELLRSAVVFAVAALDAYLNDLVLELVPQYGPQSPDLDDALTSIAKKDPGLALRVTLAPGEGQRREELRHALREHWLSKQSFHGPRMVQKALDYIDCPIPWEEFDQASGISKSDSVLEKSTQSVTRLCIV